MTRVVLCIGGMDSSGGAGLLRDAASVAAVAGLLPQVPLALDPVLASSSGRALLDRPGVAALIEALLPRAFRDCADPDRGACCRRTPRWRAAPACRRRRRAGREPSARCPVPASRG
ncbi:MAG: hypothetical protein GYB50_02505 [Rhodobacteraceae bacterium]|nr:hypothetical protein [Paracoccaceae bacterium]